MSNGIAPPSWLPEMVSVNGDWASILTRLYSVFHADFVTSTPRLKGLDVWHDRRKLEDNIEEGFWHITHVFDRRVQQRVFDPRRSERIPWCRPTMENEPQAEVQCWDYREGKGNIRTYVWLKDHDYIVVLERKSMRRGDVYMLITAFYVEHESYRRTLRRKYGQRVGP